MTRSHAAKWFLLVPLVSAVLAGCGALEAPPQEYPHATVTFDVTVPPETPATAVVTVVGSEEALGGGKAPGFRLRREPSGHHVGMVRLPVDADVSYEIWLEDAWSPELSADGERMSRHSFRVEGDMTVTSNVARWGAPEPAPPLE